MPEIISDALSIQGIGLLIFAAFLAGTVRGFSGFGTAMIYLPIAAQVLPPLWAILSLTVMDIFGPIPLLRRTSRDAQWRELGLLLVGATLLLPVGLMFLSIISPDTYRYFISGFAMALVVLLMLGVRYSGRLAGPAVLGVGGLAGFSGGLSGIPGPPVVLFYMASPHAVQVVRANTFLFLFFWEFLLIGVVGLRGDLALTPLAIGLVLAVPNGLGNMLGAAVFKPERERLYRAMAYVIVVVAALTGLPIWD